MVPEQPLEFSEHTIHHQAKHLRFNMRKLSEMPFHLVKSRRITDLKQLVFFNYRWLSVKLQAMSLLDILSDFRLALDSGFNEPELVLLANTLRISGSHLQDTPQALAYELAGRLLPYYDTHREVRSLLQQCDTVALDDTCVVPLLACFEAPRGMLTYILEDHKQVVLDLLFSKASHELVSISRDNTIAFWDMRTGDRVRMIDVSELHSGSNTRLHQSDDGCFLICDSDAINSPALIFDMKTGQLLHRVGRRLTTQRRCFAVGHLLMRQKSIINIKTGKVIATLDDFIQSKKYLTCGITPNQKYIVLGESHRTCVFNIETRQLLISFPGSHQPCQFLFTSDSALCYTGYTEDCLFKIFDIDPSSGNLGRTRLVYNYLEAFPELVTMDAPIYANEVSTIAVSPQDEAKVLICIKRCQLILLDVVGQNSRKLDMSAMYALGDKATAVADAWLSWDGKFVIAATGTHMHIWSAEDYNHIYGVNIHTIERFPICVSQQRNLVATGSTLHTAIKTWDLDKIQMMPDMELIVYMNPIDVLAVDASGRLMYVKKYHRMNYKYIDYFGIDVWNISTGTVQPCLATGKYGELLQMAMSRDGQQMAMLISTRDQSYVCALSVRLNRVLAFHRHPGCTRFVLSNNCEFLATQAIVDGVSEVKLWCFKGGELARFEEGECPVFTAEDDFLLYTEGGKSIEVFSLKEMQGVNSMLCEVTQIAVIPTLGDYVVASGCAQLVSPRRQLPACHVSVWHIIAGYMISQFANVAPSGMKDFSKDGRICIDGYLQVFDVKSGKLLARLCGGSSRELDMVRLTYDGQYAIWVQDLSFRVARVNENLLIGHICTHEKPVSLELLDYGYIIVVGREDGHILTAKLIDGLDNLPNQFRPHTSRDRLRTIVQKLIYPDGIVATFESMYQTKPKSTSDSSLHKFSKDVQNTLLDRAKVPHAVIKTARKTSSFGDLKEFEKEFSNRRGSSPGLCESKADKSAGNGQFSTAPCRLKKGVKSPSLSSLFVHHTTGRRISRENSPNLQDMFKASSPTSPPTPTRLAVHHTSSLLVALTDISGSMSKLFKRKSSETQVTNSPMMARKVEHSPMSCPSPPSVVSQMSLPPPSSVTKPQLNTDSNHIPVQPTNSPSPKNSPRAWSKEWRKSAQKIDSKPPKTPTRSGLLRRRAPVQSSSSPVRRAELSVTLAGHPHDTAKHTSLTDTIPTGTEVRNGGAKHNSVHGTADTRSHGPPIATTGILALRTQMPDQSTPAERAPSPELEITHL